MSNDLEDSDEDYFTASDGETSKTNASEVETFEVPGRRLQQDSDEETLTASKDETSETDASEVETFEVPGRRLQQASGENIFKREDQKFEVSGRRLSGTEVAPGSASFEEIRLLLIGKAGHGKSATANSILGLQKGQDGSFVEKIGSMSETEVAKRKKGLHCGRVIEVVDSADFCDSKLTDNQAREAVLKAILLTLPGFSAVGFVLKPERFSDKQVQAVELFIETFGDNVKNFLFIILTHVQDEESAEEYFTDCHESLEKLKRLCTGGKFVFIDNKCKKDGKKDQQVQSIIDAIDSIKRRNGDSFFSNQLFEEATCHALNCTPIQAVMKTDATSDDQLVLKRLEMFKEKIENDTNGAFSDLLNYNSGNTEMLRKIALNVVIGLIRLKCSVM